MNEMPARKVDALIIGGGIIGLAIGYYLARRNFCNVEIIERESAVTMHASGHNAGGLSGIHASHPRSLWPLYRRSQQLYSELAESSGFDFDYARIGSLVPGSVEVEKDFESTAREFEDGKEGVEVEFLGRDDLQNKEPNLSKHRFSCALYYPLDAQGNSLKLGRSFAGSCLEKGIKITTGCKVTGFEVSASRVTSVKTDRGTYDPGIVILAAGPWSGEVSARLGLDIPVSPIKGHLITINTAGVRLVKSFISGPNYYVMQNSSEVIVGGGEDPSGFNTLVDQTRINEAWSEGISMVPILGSYEKSPSIRTACLRPYAKDGIPIIGASRRLSNVLFATGHFRTGFGLAPITGMLISELIVDGRSSMDLSAFSPDRF